MNLYVKTWGMTLGVVFAIVLVNNGWAAPPDPLAPARAGLIECEDIDEAAKTCSELAEYVPRADGLFDLTSRKVLSQNPHVVWIYRSTVFVEADKICAKLTTPDFDMMTFEIDGKQAGAEQAMQLRNVLRSGWPEIADKTSCMKLVQTKTGLVSEYYLDGLIQIQDGRTPMKWVKPDEGYNLLGAK